MGSYFGGGRQDTVQFTVQDLKFFSFVTDIFRLGQSNIWSASIKRETYLIDIPESKRKKRSRQSQVPKRFKCSANGPQNFSFQHSRSILDSLTFLLSKTNIEIGKITRIWKCERSNTQSQHTFFWNQFVLYFHFPDKETIYCNSGTSLSLTNNFVSLNGGAKGSHSAKRRLQDIYLAKLISLNMAKNKSKFISQKYNRWPSGNKQGWEKINNDSFAQRWKIYCTQPRSANFRLWLSAAD